MSSLKKTSVIEIEEYAQSFPHYYRIIAIPTLRKYLDKTTFVSLLDCGCGDGVLLYTLKHYGYFLNRKINAIDLSKNRIDLVKKMDPTIHAFVDSAETMKNIKSNSIDFLISMAVIEHVDDKKMLNAVDRVLVKGGTAYITTVFKKWYGWYFYRNNGKWVIDNTHLREYMKDDELLGLINTNKFRIIETKKTQLYFPIIDFIIRILLSRNLIKNREITKNPLFHIIKNIKIPIIGYYSWEVILKKR